MSYDLIFWKELSSMGAPRSTYEQLNNCLPADLPQMPGLDRLPLVEIFSALKNVFPGIYQPQKDAWNWSSDFRLYPKNHQEIIAEYGSLPESPWPEDSKCFICYFSDYHLNFCLNYEVLSLTLENEPVHGAPSLTQILGAVDQLTPYGGPGYLILEGYGEDYLQVAGGNGMYTVEWRITEADESFQHWIVGLADEPSMPLVRIVANGRIITVQQNEELSAKDAKVLLLSYANQKGRPMQYSWRDVSSMFGP